VAALGAALAAGCDTPSAPKPFMPGISVQYSGAVSGHFSVIRGTSASQIYSEDFWADSSGFVSYSRAAAADRRINWITMIGPVTPGEYTFQTNCVARCYGVAVGLGQAPEGPPQEGEVSWGLERGVITVRAPSADGRVGGTFSGSGQLHRFTGGKWHDLGEVTASGTFETSLVPPHRVE